MAIGGYIGVDGKARKMKAGYIGVDGVARKVKKAYVGVNGVARLWYAGEVRDPGTCLTFSSPSTFSIGIKVTPGWDGTMEYSTPTTDWATWDGSTISAGSDGSKYALYLRGTGNTKFTGDTSTTTSSVDSTMVITGSNVSCDGRLDTLLDYATVKSGTYPTMAQRAFIHMFHDCTALVTPPDLTYISLTAYCYSHMFNGCTNLTTAPELPFSSLPAQCYSNMFRGCTSLTAAPDLPGSLNLETACCHGMFRECTNLTTIPALDVNPVIGLPAQCFRLMFSGCTSLKLSATQTSEYAQSYKPYTWAISSSYTIADSALTSMFSSTGGTFTGTPEAGVTYYLHKDCSIV